MLHSTRSLPVRIRCEVPTTIRSASGPRAGSVASAVSPSVLESARRPSGRQAEGRRTGRSNVNWKAVTG